MSATLFMEETRSQILVESVCDELSAAPVLECTPIVLVLVVDRCGD